MQFSVVAVHISKTTTLATGTNTHRVLNSTMFQINENSYGPSPTFPHDLSFYCVMLCIQMALHLAYNNQRPL